MTGFSDLGGFLLMMVLTCAGAQTVIKTMQSTTWNTHYSDYAVDSNLSSCAVTGYDFNAEWTVVLDAIYSIHDVYVYGGGHMPNLRIAVNDDFNVNGRVCAHWIKEPIPLPNGINFSCGNQVPRGSKITITSTVNKGGHQLSLCDVKINAK